jgi:hypothetical protein
MSAKLPLEKLLTRAQLSYVDFMLDVLVYTAVLNLFDEYVDSFVIDSFTVSLLTAVVMKFLLDAIEFLVLRVKAHFSGREGAAARVTFGLVLWAILFFSKILILEIIAVIFEEDVDLGGFLNVLILVLVMMVARRLSFAILLRLGPPKDAPTPPAATPGVQ